MEREVEERFERIEKILAASAERAAAEQERSELRLAGIADMVAATAESQERSDRRIADFVAATAENHARSERRLAAIENVMASLSLKDERSGRRLDRLERLVVSMSRIGVRWRSEVDARRAESDRNFVKLEQLVAEIGDKLAETNDKLNGLIGVVDRWPRQNPQ